MFRTATMRTIITSGPFRYDGKPVTAGLLRHRVHIAHFAACLGCRQFRRMALLVPSVRRTAVGPRWLG